MLSSHKHTSKTGENMATQLIYVAGDVHAKWNILNAYINKNMRQSKKFKEFLSTFEEDTKNVEIILLQCGDFGIWEESDITNLPVKNKIEFIKDGHIKIYFADGNHENHDLLDKLEEDNPNKAFPEIIPYVYFGKFGSVLKLLDGTKIMFCGGAESEDKAFRILGTEWWPQEGIDEIDMMNLPPTSESVDWIISHAAPFSFDLGVYVYTSRYGKLNEPSRHKLEEIFQKYQPTRWYFGHYHYNYLRQNNDCRWQCMNYSDANDLRSWISLEKVIKL